MCVLNEKMCKIFNIRVNSYSYPHHGQYDKYVNYCREQYQLDCIPKNCQQGENYNGNSYRNYCYNS